MVATKDRLSAPASPQTCCTNCNTVFEIPQELLTSQDTRVRCGECLCIFDAMDGLSLPGQFPEADDTDSEHHVASLSDSGFSDLDVTYSDFDLFSEDADLPEVAYLDETEEAAEFDFDAVDTSDDRTFTDTMFHHDVTINADIPMEATSDQSEADESMDGSGAAASGAVASGAAASASDAGGSETLRSDSAHSGADPLLAQLASVKYPPEPQVPAEPLVFEYPDDDDSAAIEADLDIDIEPQFDVLRMPPEDATQDAVVQVQPVPLQPPQAHGGKLGPWLLLSAMVMFLAVLLGGLYAYQEREELGNNPRTRPLMAAACWVFRCDLPAFFDPTRLRVLGRHVYTHPDIDGALVVNVVFRNEASVDQRYPVLLIKLSNINGELVASREFQPAEYLTEAMLAQSAVLVAKTSLDISLEIRDPGTDASSFEMEFR